MVKSLPMRLSARFPSVFSNQKDFISVLKISPSIIFWVGFIPPLAGAIIAIVTALTVHQQRVTNYNWICGRAFLPSLSRIINLDFEGIFWQICMYFHFPLRLFEIYVGFFRYGRLRAVNAPRPWLYLASRIGYAIFGVLELIFLVGLSAVGEKEHGVYHVFLFYTFGVFAFAFFVTNAICHSQSLYYLPPYGRLSYRLKIVFAALYCGSIPLIFTFYVLYWKGCITFAYELFAFTEYVDVFLSMAYHGCALLDIRHKVITEVRIKKRNREVKEALPLEEISTTHL